MEPLFERQDLNSEEQRLLPFVKEILKQEMDSIVWQSHTRSERTEQNLCARIFEELNFRGSWEGTIYMGSIVAAAINELRAEAPENKTTLSKNLQDDRALQNFARVAANYSSYSHLIRSKQPSQWNLGKVTREKELPRFAGGGDFRLSLETVARQAAASPLEVGRISPDMLMTTARRRDYPAIESLVVPQVRLAEAPGSTSFAGQRWRQPALARPFAADLSSLDISMLDGSRMRRAMDAAGFLRTSMTGSHSGGADLSSLLSQELQ
jgi:hypothetical protein